MPNGNRPILSNEARDHAKHISDDFHGHLVEIAVELAVAGKCEQVLCPHVNESLLALKRSGMKPPKAPPQWYERASFKVGLGSMLVGLAPAFAGFAKDLTLGFSAAPISSWLFIIVVPIALGVGGFCLAAYGWLQSDDNHSD